KKALVLVADGSEEMETVTVVDVLRRAGVDVTLAAVKQASPKAIHFSRKVNIVPDVSFEHLAAAHQADGGAAKLSADYDAVVLPGGLPGANHVAENAGVQKLLKAHYGAGKLTAAICAAPIAFAAADIGTHKGVRLTSHPCVKDKLADLYAYLEDRVVVDCNLITSRGPGTATEFAFEVARHLVGLAAVRKAAEPMFL
ncbi:DJ-1, partial [Ramicandelaber brevisporus]